MRYEPALQLLREQTLRIAAHDAERVRLVAERDALIRNLLRARVRPRTIAAYSGLSRAMIHKIKESHG